MRAWPRRHRAHIAAQSGRKAPNGKPGAPRNIEPNGTGLAAAGDLAPHLARLVEDIHPIPFPERLREMNGSL
ncbi:MAG TPA: hypothetical protein VJR87_08750 [Allosphingosinicella sp.]|nr:hypothetical protein [Allosphingosinicella sp.]